MCANSRTQTQTPQPTVSAKPLTFRECVRDTQVILCLQRQDADLLLYRAACLTVYASFDMKNILKMRWFYFGLIQINICLLIWLWFTEWWCHAINVHIFTHIRHVVTGMQSQSIGPPLWFRLEYLSRWNAFSVTAFIVSLSRFSLHPAIITDLCSSSGTCQLFPPPNAAATPLCRVFHYPHFLIRNLKNNRLSEQKHHSRAFYCWSRVQIWWALLKFIREDVWTDVQFSLLKVDAVAQWLIMDVLSGAWFSLKLIGGRYAAFQPCLWSFRSIVSSVTSRRLILQRPGWSCLVLSCLILQMSPDILVDGQHDDLTSPTTTSPEKALSSPCAAEEVYFGQSALWCQRRHSLRGVNREQSEVL